MRAHHRDSFDPLINESVTLINGSGILTRGSAVPKMGKKKTFP